VLVEPVLGAVYEVVEGHRLNITTSRLRVLRFLTVLITFSVAK